jgi:hypothetical protein
MKLGKSAKADAASKGNTKQTSAQHVLDMMLSSARHGMVMIL